jgi:regulator of sirC expression with transglutaminase-like and TPR domain
MTPIEQFAALVGNGERPTLPLLAAAAQVPLYAEPDCEPQRTLDQLQAWAGQLRPRVVPDASGPTRLRLLNHFFFRELGFKGARRDYLGAENSYLHRVIERRRGIPITLSLLYMELGKAAGLRLQGVCFPGHFLIKLKLSDGMVFIDVFGGGTTLSSDELRARLSLSLPQAAGVALGPYLRAASDREILARLLRNLKAIHWEAREWPAALEVMNRLVAVVPDDAQERCDRARVYERLECPRAAASDLVACLSLNPARPDAVELRDRLRQLQQSAARLN